MQSNNLSFTHSNNTKILSSNSLGLAESKILQFETLLAKCLYYNGLIIESTPSTTISLKRTPRIGLGRSTVFFFYSTKWKPTLRAEVFFWHRSEHLQRDVRDGPLEITGGAGENVLVHGFFKSPLVWRNFFLGRMAYSF